MTSDEIVDTFLARWFCPTQQQIDLLLVRLGIPAQALMHDADGGGYPMGMLRVERGRRTFDFSDDPETRPACGFIAWDRWGEAQDIVAWSPRDGWTGTLLGRAAILGEHELFAPRIEGPLRAYTDVLAWLQAGREGCVILDGKRARRDLEGVKLAASSVEEGLALRKMLSAPDPRIVVPAQAVERVAA